MDEPTAIDGELTWEGMDAGTRELDLPLSDLPYVRAPRWIRFPGPGAYEEAREAFPALPPWSDLEHDEQGGATMYLDRHGRVANE